MDAANEFFLGLQAANLAPNTIISNPIERVCGTNGHLIVPLNNYMAYSSPKQSKTIFQRRSYARPAEY